MLALSLVASAYVSPPVVSRPALGRTSDVTMQLSKKVCLRRAPPAWSACRDAAQKMLLLCAVPASAEKVGCALTLDAPVPCAQTIQFDQNGLFEGREVGIAVRLQCLTPAEYCSSAARAWLLLTLARYASSVAEAAGASAGAYRGAQAALVPLQHWRALLG